MIYPDESAFPGRQPMGEAGLTIRAYLTSKAMQGLLSNTNINLAPCEIAQDAVLYADALIAELNKEGK